MLDTETGPWLVFIFFFIEESLQLSKNECRQTYYLIKSMRKANGRKSRWQPKGASGSMWQVGY